MSDKTPKAELNADADRAARMKLEAQEEWDDALLDEYPTAEEEEAELDEARCPDCGFVNGCNCRESNPEIWNQLSPFAKRQADPDGAEYYDDKED